MRETHKWTVKLTAVQEYVQKHLSYEEPGAPIHIQLEKPLRGGPTATVDIFKLKADV